jgi:hypothetical protein
MSRYPYVQKNNKKRYGNQWRAILNSSIQQHQLNNTTTSTSSSTSSTHSNPGDHDEENDDMMIIDAPETTARPPPPAISSSSDVFVTAISGVINPAQRALRFNLNDQERAQFIASKPRTRLFKHQEDGVEFMRMREAPGNKIAEASGGIIHLPPRTGKTKLFLMRVYQDVQERVARGETRFGMPTLLIVPKNVADTMAFENTELFAEDYELLSRVILSDSALDKKDVYDIIASHDLIITSYSTLMAFYQRWIRNFGICDDVGPNLMFRTKWRRVIADEAHRLANNKNVIFDAVASLKSEHSWYVTATPIQNSPTDVLSALRFLRVNELYIKMECVPVLLKELLFRRDYDDLVKINPDFARLIPPSREEMNLKIDFDVKSERILYDYVHDQSFLHLYSTELFEGKRAPSVFTEGVRPENMALRLRQACVDAWLLPENFKLPTDMRYSTEEMDGDEWLRWVHSKLMGTTPSVGRKQGGGEEWPGPNVLPPISTKERVVLDYIRTEVEPKHEKIIIFSEWTSSLNRLHQHLLWRAYIRQGHRNTVPEDGVVCVNGTIKGPQRRQALQHMWTNPNKYIMLVTLQSGGLGEDFTFANHGILIDPWWTPATEFQAIMRLYGIKQTRPVRIIVLCIGNTVEDYVQARANRKLGYESVMQVSAPTNTTVTTKAKKREVNENDDGDDNINDPMLINDDGGDGLLVDPNEEPTFLDPNWFNGYLEMAIRQPMDVDNDPVYEFNL